MKDIKQTLSTITKEIEEMIAEIFQIFEKMNIDKHFTQTVAYKQSIVYIGGYYDNKGTSCDLICELQVTGIKSHILKVLCHMPESRLSHGAEIINDEIFVFGGYGKEDKILSGLIKIDPRSLKIKAMPPFPHPLAGMATVQ